MRPNQAFIFALGVLTPVLLAAQEAGQTTVAPAATGIVAGKVVDEATGRGIPGVSVSVMGESVYSTTDVDGNYRLFPVTAGTCAVSFYKGGYQYASAENLSVAADAVTRLDFSLAARQDTGEEPSEGDIVMLDPITVVASVAQDNQIGLQAVREKSLNVSDAIGSDDFSKQGLGDAAEAMSRVTGASVMDGKYVLIRGLGDRYANTLMNGIALPSADPDKRAVQMDQFPTGLLESIRTAKSFTPDLPGDFAGGSVDVKTKSFPDAFFATLSISSSWNSNTTGKEILSSPQGVTWSGMDADNRVAPALVEGLVTPQTAIAAARRTVNPTLEPAQLLSDFSRGFESGMYPKKVTAAPNFGFGASVGDQVKWGKDGRIGYTVSVSYDRSSNSFDGGYLAAVNPIGGLKALYSPVTADYDFAEKLDGAALPWGDKTDWGYTKSSQSVNWGAFTKLAWQPGPNHEISLDLYHNQFAEDEVRRGVGEEPEDYASMIYENIAMLYTERGLSSGQLHGKHTLPDLYDATVEWNAGWSESTQKQPDFRILQSLYDMDIGGYSTNTLFPASRFFRDMEETARSGGMDVTVPFALVRDLESRLKFGGLFSHTSRTYTEDQFTMYYGRGGTSVTSYEMMVNAYKPENTGILKVTERASGGWDVAMGWTAVETPSYVSNYDGSQDISAGYVMGDLLLAKDLRLVAGARAEGTDLSVNTFKKDGTLIDEARIEETDILPAASVIYTLREGMNLRLAYGRTIARPTFKELTSSRLYDPFRREYYQGNPGLAMTRIDNLDLRWEWFLPKGNMLAASAFYKKMTDPIEVLFKADASGASTGMSIVSPRNREEGRVQGLELEYRYDLSNFTDFLTGFTAGGNASIMDSKVSGASEGQAMPDMPLVGQSRYVLNANLTYQNFGWGTTATILVNKVGSRLIEVTQSEALADIYENPPVTFNFILSQKLGHGLTAKFSATNLLDSPYEATLGKGSSSVIERYKRGRTFGISLSYDF